jgi:NADH-quinone oxidoreductase subunit M
VVIWMGVYPSSFLDVMHVSVQNLIDNYQAAIKAAGAAKGQASLLDAGGLALSGDVR